MKTIFNITRLRNIAFSSLIICAMHGCALKNDDVGITPALTEAKPAESDDLALLKNEDVDWNGTYNGIEPELREPAAKILKQIRDEYKVGEHQTRDRLVSLLSDPQRFVVAHVLLTSSCYGQKFVMNGSSWNGLEVYLNRDGSVRIDTEQCSALEAKWKAEAALP